MSSNAYSIRPMRIEDYDAVAALWQHTENMALREADSRDAIAAYLTHNPDLSFVATVGESIVGAILAGTDGRRGYVQHLAVDVPYRKQGLGEQLLTAVTSALSARGIHKTHLFVLNENTYAQRYYEWLNWQRRDDIQMFSFNASTHSNI